VHGTIMTSMPILKRPSRGFSLLEVMISVGILSVALLGTAGLMASSLRGTNTAYYRSQATILTDDILDRMRTNLAEAKKNSYDIDNYTSATGPTLTGKTGLALYDCTEWTKTIADTFPGGVGTVKVTPDYAVTVEIKWDEGDSSFATETHL
jgi:type IV pilus assembly protein PilV